MNTEELAEKLEADAVGMSNLSQSAWGIAEPKMYGDTVIYDAALQGFFMAVYEYCAGASNELRQAAARLRSLEGALRYVDARFEDAMNEGWMRALDSRDVKVIEDLWRRRISYAWSNTLNFLQVADAERTSVDSQAQASHEQTPTKQQQDSGETQ